MIRINLLPVRRRPGEEIIRKEVSLFLLLILVTVGVMAYIHIGHTHEINKLVQGKKRIDREIIRYRGRQKQLKELEETKKLLVQKLEIIDQLRMNRDLPVRVLSELATRIPSEKIWVKKISQSGKTLSLDGIARNNEIIAQFMESLAASPYIDANRVVLEQSRQVVIEGYKLKGFRLTCHIVVPPKEKRAEKRKKQEA
ncbi:MAG: PilN domain-containing protein [Syntrophobacteria bacterium]